MLGLSYSLLGLAIAMILDCTFGDPQTKFHPVRWQGHFIGYLWSRRPIVRDGNADWYNPVRLFFWGFFIVFSGLIFTALSAGGLHWAGTVILGPAGSQIDWLRFLSASLLLGVVLKGTFSFGGLLKAGDLVRKSLEDGDLEAAQVSTAYHLVSRSTSELSETEICSAVLESVSENFTDSVAAPLLWYALGGVTAAWCYRFANTADAMLGYRVGEKEWGGKAAAKLDDFLSWLPSRVAGLLFIISCIPSRADSSGAFRAMREDGKKVPSPNSGWTMAAAAGALGVRLEKTNTYILNPAGRPPTAGDIKRLFSVLRWSVFNLSLTTAILIAAIRLLAENFL